MRSTSLCRIALLAIGFATSAAASPDYSIRLLGGAFTPRPGVSAAARQGLTQAAAEVSAQGQDKIHLLVQLYGVPTEEEKNELWRDGLDLGAWVPGNAWIAAVPLGRLAAVTARSDVRYAAHWSADRKLHPNLRAGDIAAWARDPTRPEWVMTVVQLHHDVDLGRIYSLALEVGGVVMDPLEGLHGATVWVLQDKLAKLTEKEEVLWVEEGPPPLTANNDGVRALMRIDPLITAPYTLDGTGVRLFVFDAGTARTTHEQFRVGAGASRVTLIDAQPAAAHPTHVAGTAAGDGAPSSPSGRGRGVAVDASILSAGYQQVGGTMLFWDNSGDIQGDYANARNNFNADLGTNSIGSNTAANGYPCVREGDYGVSSNMIDGIVRGNNPAVTGPVMVTWAAGNERTGGFPRGRCGGGYFTSAPPSCAKNPIHVGALSSDGGAMTRFSSWGPCDDGRMKPVISAPGCETGRVTGETAVFSGSCSALTNPPPPCTSDTLYTLACGTSMATPAVAGVVSLFTEDWRARGFGGANARPLAAMVKAMMIHSARDLGQDGPDYIYGYGSVDAKGLIDLLRAGNNTLGGTAPQRWGTDSVSQGQTDAFTITVPAGAGELKATLAWDDFAAAAFTAFAPVNNLDLELLSPGGVTVRPWVLSSANPHLNATTGINTLDNQEQVRVTNPQAGVWTVRVVGTTVPQGPQSYGLTFTSLPHRYQEAACATTTWGFETGNDGWTLNGATRVAAPAAGHGSWSLHFGNALSVVHEATQNVAIPAGSGRVELSYFWYLQTQHPGTIGSNYDALRVEVRNATTGVPLAVLGEQQESWRLSTWMNFTHVDLTPWAGQTVTLAFRFQEKVYPPGGGQPADNLTSRIWVDDVSLVTCPLAETDVWSRDLATDTGVEPNPDPGPMWTSPDIWVRNQDDGGTVHQNPEFGQTNYIHANVRNRSLVEGVNVPVKFYLANASVGLSWPAQWTLVGTTTLPSVMPGQVVVAKVPWNPPGVGHFCIVVRLDTTQDPMTFPEGANITVNVRNNNNIVWKNVNIVNLIPPGTVENAAGAEGNATVDFIFRNVEELDMDLNLVFRTERGSQNFLSRGRVTVSLEPAMAEIWAANGNQGDGIEQIDDLTFAVIKDPAHIFVPLKALEEFSVRMTFEDTGVVITPADAVPAPQPEPIPHQLVYRFSVVEENANDETQEAIGGVTYEIQAPPVAVPIDPEPLP